MKSKNQPLRARKLRNSDRIISAERVQFEIRAAALKRAFENGSLKDIKAAQAIFGKAAKSYMDSL